MSALELTITEPGVFDAVPAEVYQADPVPGGSLSSTGARKLLPPSCPALFRHWRDHDRAQTRAFDIGHAAHKLVLGVGPELVAVLDKSGKNPDEWRTNDCKAEVAAVRERGGIPLKRHDLDTVTAMAAALREHSIARLLLRPGHGDAEQTLVWRDERTGVWCRARPDWLPATRKGQQVIVVDYKTTESAAVEHLRRSVWNYGYYLQGPWYLAGLAALGIADDARFVFIAQEKTPPFLVTVFELDTVAMRVGRARAAQALEIYRDCVAADVWPGHSDTVELITLPGWAERQFTEETW